MRKLTVATYNVHQWLGTDGRHDTDRCLRVIRELNADVIGLQEVTVPNHDEHDVMEEHLAESTEMRVVFGPTMLRAEASFGNVLLHRHDALEVRHHDLTVAGREPRGAIETLFRLQDHSVRVVTTHLGLRASERRKQIPCLLEILNRPAALYTLLMGDFNHWLPTEGPFSTLNRWFGRTPSARTYPARLPLLALDRIWVRPRELLTGLRVHTSKLARRASDHLPLLATIALP
jgi:phospholipase D1/2